MLEIDGEYTRHGIMPTIDTIWSNMQLRASPDWTSQISYDVVSSLPAAQPVWAVPMSFCTIATKYNGHLEAVHARDLYDYKETVERAVIRILHSSFILKKLSVMLPMPACMQRFLREFGGHVSPIEG